MTSRIKTLVLALAIAAAPIAFGAANDLSPKDQAFATKIANANLAELEQSKIAQERTQNSKIKSYASMMLSDHGAAGQKFDKLAQTNGWNLPKSLDPEHQAKLDQLAQLQGRDFDRQYVMNMKEGHDAAMALFRDTAKTADSSELRGFATDVLPTIEQHRKQSGELPPSINRN